MVTLLDVNAHPVPRRPAFRPVTTRLHLHWYRHWGVDPFGNGSLYACRCGVVRTGI